MWSSDTALANRDPNSIQKVGRWATRNAPAPEAEEHYGDRNALLPNHARQVGKSSVAVPRIGFGATALKANAIVP